MFPMHSKNNSLVTLDKVPVDMCMQSCDHNYIPQLVLDIIL